jgi:hypothetical protein
MPMVPKAVGATNTLRAACEASFEAYADHKRHGIRLGSCFGYIALIVTVGRALLELNHRYGKPKKLRTKA